MDNISLDETQKINELMQQYLVDISIPHLNLIKPIFKEPTQEELKEKLDPKLTQIWQKWSRQDGLADQQLLELIQNENLNLHAEDEVLLSFAVEKRPDIALFLIENGADYNARNGAIINKAIKLDRVELLVAIMNIEDSVYLQRQDIQDKIKNFHNSSPDKLIQLTFQDRISEKNNKEITKLSSAIDSIKHIIEEMNKNNNLSFFQPIYKEISKNFPINEKNIIDDIIFPHYTKTKEFNETKQNTINEKNELDKNSSDNNVISPIEKNKKTKKHDIIDSFETKHGLLTKKQLQEKWDLFLFSAYYENSKKKITTLYHDFKIDMKVSTKDFKKIKLLRTPVYDLESQKNVTIQFFVEKQLSNIQNVLSKHNKKSFLDNWSEFHSNIKSNTVRTNFIEIFNSINSDDKLTKENSSINNIDRYVNSLENPSLKTSYYRKKT